MPQVTINKERCKGCALCVNACPKKILVMGREINSKGYFYATVADASKCNGCCFCCINCPDVAITMEVEGENVRVLKY